MHSIVIWLPLCRYIVHADSLTFICLTVNTGIGLGPAKKGLALKRVAGLRVINPDQRLDPTLQYMYLDSPSTTNNLTIQPHRVQQTTSTFNHKAHSITKTFNHKAVINPTADTGTDRQRPSRVVTTRNLNDRSGRNKPRSDTTVSERWCQGDRRLVRNVKVEPLEICRTHWWSTKLKM